MNQKSKKIAAAATAATVNPLESTVTIAGQEYDYQGLINLPTVFLNTMADMLDTERNHSASELIRFSNFHFLPKVEKAELLLIGNVKSKRAQEIITAKNAEMKAVSSLRGTGVKARQSAIKSGHTTLKEKAASMMLEHLKNKPFINGQPDFNSIAKAYRSTVVKLYIAETTADKTDKTDKAGKTKK